MKIIKKTAEAGNLKFNQKIVKIAPVERETVLTFLVKDPATKLGKKKTQVCFKLPRLVGRDV